jgi:hypothetical protein
VIQFDHPPPIVLHPVEPPHILLFRPPLITFLAPLVSQLPVPPPTNPYPPDDVLELPPTTVEYVP